ncbi:hypothetical protein [Deinococcus navajonensis]|uniref:Uncharacterized protein n=1 Tax=Deinococcus navajonensis TaxID=309884 RepID=A0ABV8XJZ6_9DEIO
MTEKHQRHATTSDVSRWALAAGLSVSAVAGAQDNEYRNKRTKAFYWKLRDPSTPPNMSSVILDSEETGHASLMLKCTGNGHMYFYFTSPLKLIPEGDPLPLNQTVANLYRVTVPLGQEAFTPKLSLVGYLPVRTNALAFDARSTTRIFNALFDTCVVKVRIAGRPGAPQRHLNVPFAFVPVGFSEAGDAVDNGDAG